MALPDKVHEPVCSRSTWGSLIAGRLTCWLQPGRRRTHASIEPLPAGGALHQPGRGWLWWRHMAAIWLCELRRSASRMSLRRRHQHIMGCQPVADQAGDQEGSRAKGRVGSKPPTAGTAGTLPAPELRLIDAPMQVHCLANHGGLQVGCQAAQRVASHVATVIKQCTLTRDSFKVSSHSPRRSGQPSLPTGLTQQARTRAALQLAHRCAVYFLSQLRHALPELSQRQPGNDRQGGDCCPSVEVYQVGNLRKEWWLGSGSGCTRLCVQQQVASSRCTRTEGFIKP
jgi:hypothetical protein